MKRLYKLAGAGVLIGVLACSWCMTARVHASPNDFTFQSFSADYYLSRDEEKRSRLSVTERLVAEFPEIDQNHGIERAIPNMYDGHSEQLSLTSVRDETGKPYHYTTYESNDNTVIRIGDADRYVHGVNTYLISYELRDVTKNFKDHSELYWDTNGTGWKQRFDRVTATVHLPRELAGLYTGRTRCFVGIEGTGAPCVQETKQEGDAAVLTFSAGRALTAHENLTFVVGFEPDSFQEFQPSLWQRLLPIIRGVWISINIAVFAVIIWSIVKLTRRYGRSPRGRSSLVAEYLPPKGLNVLQSAAILGKSEPALSAQIIDLAVRHFVRIYDTESKNWLGQTSHRYELGLVRGTAKLSSEERELVNLLFGNQAQPGERIAVDSLKSKLYEEGSRLRRAAYDTARDAGYFTNRSEERRRYLWRGGLLALGGTVALQPGVAVGGVLLCLAVLFWRPLSEQGVAMRQYLFGLQKYMRLAEAERLQQLQSPGGAARSIDPSNKHELVRLYERLLPYAMLFGIEREWAKQFAVLYEQPPEWFAGNWSTFNAAAFSSSFQTFSAASQSVFTAPHNSSSSGFSGGGSSGGGGGGGGGGGW